MPKDEYSQIAKRGTAATHSSHLQSESPSVSSPIALGSVLIAWEAIEDGSRGAKMSAIVSWDAVCAVLLFTDSSLPP